MSTGIDRYTGKPISDWQHVTQSILTILETRIGDRIMRRNFGSAVPGVLGRNLVPVTLLRFYTAIAIAIELWEPRFRVRSFEYPQDSNSADNLRQGRIGFRMVGDYRPRALEGDFTIETVKTVTI